MLMTSLVFSSIFFLGGGGGGWGVERGGGLEGEGVVYRKNHCVVSFKAVKCCYYHDFLASEVIEESLGTSLDIF